MSENLFNFPEGTPAAEDNANFGASIFQDLGSDAGEGNPFADMEPAADTADTAAPQSEDASSSETADIPNVEPPATAEPIFSQVDAPAEEMPTAEEPSAAPAPSATAPVQAKQAKTPPAAQTEEDNPLMAAMDLQEEKNARKAAEPIFAQLPVFSYNGSTEPIENVNQTFDELRLAKAEDFPEFEEAQSVSWTVSYGKVNKTVSTPRKVKIGDLKREIETSKEFMDRLKKEVDKNPKCIVKPTVHMQKKGVMSCGYKGFFPTLTQARQSDKTICFIPGHDGRVYERRVSPAGEFITTTGNVSMLDSISPGFTPALPRIPYTLMAQAVSLFRCLMTAGINEHPLEALVNIYWDKETEAFFLDVPHQKVGRASVDAVLDNEELLNSDRYIHYADLHSHNDMKAVFSKRDDHDERANRVYMVIGRLDRYYPEISVRICNGGTFLPIRPDLVLEPSPLTAFPSQWLQNISLLEEEELGAAA
jgi:hypothetical protein